MLEPTGGLPGWQACLCSTELSTRTSYSPTRKISPFILWKGDKMKGRMDSLVPKAFALTFPLTFYKKKMENLGSEDHHDQPMGLCVPPVESADRFFRRLVWTLRQNETTIVQTFRELLNRKLPWFIALLKPFLHNILNFKEEFLVLYHWVYRIHKYNILYVCLLCTCI
jgi:hypothetical protein